MYETFYIEKLYPLQDKVLRLINSLATNFYLTGGTALSRCYVKHRYSDDLDFIVNDLPTFRDEVFRIQNELDRNFFVEIQRTGERFQRLMLKGEDTLLKLEFINDVPFHFGNLESTDIFGSVDNPLNILSNKISAIMDRDEAKDFADVFSIASYLEEIDWKTIFVSASSKSAGIFAPLVAERIAHFDFNRLDQIKWNSNYRWEALKQKQQEIVHSIIGLEN